MPWLDKAESGLSLVVIVVEFQVIACRIDGYFDVYELTLCGEDRRCATGSQAVIVVDFEKNFDGPVQYGMKGTEVI